MSKMDSLKIFIILLCFTEVCLIALWHKISLNPIIFMMKLKGITIGNNNKSLSGINYNFDYNIKLIVEVM